MICGSGDREVLPSFGTPSLRYSKPDTKGIKEGTNSGKAFRGIPEGD